MQSGRIRGATRTIGKSQGYLGLAIRDEVINCPVNGPNTADMVTAWFPSVEEMQRMAAGAPIYLRILGTVHPPVMLDVGEPPK